MKTVAEIAALYVETDAERSWAERMGTDYRRAWDTAPTLSMLFAIATHVATRAGQRHFLSSVLSVLGGDASRFDVLSAAIQIDAPPGREAAMNYMQSLSRLQVPQRELADRLRTRVSHASLIEGLS